MRNGYRAFAFNVLRGKGVGRQLLFLQQQLFGIGYQRLAPQGELRENGCHLPQLQIL